MNDDNTRRQFLRQAAVTTTALGTLAIPQQVHAAGTDVIRIGLVGCGGRGTGAAINALTAEPNAVLVAIGDAFADRSASCLKTLQDDQAVADRISVDSDHVFAGFDAYKNVVDSDVDVVILATPPHFRPEHLKYVVEKSKHCFVEKPIAVDVPGVKSVLETCAEAKRKKLAIVSGLCWRYDAGVRETIQRIQDGAIGEVLAIESVYNSGTLWHRGDKPDWSRMEYQMRNWLYYTWLSGDHVVEQAIHNLDRASWLLGDVSPSQAMGIGGRQQRTDPKYGHIFDHHTVFYEYESGVRMFFTCRQQDNCSMSTNDRVIGTHGTARIIKNQIRGKTKWRYRSPRRDSDDPEMRGGMYVAEHQEMFKSIRDGNPINNGEYMCNSTMIAIMGRMATYTGQTLTWEQAFGSEQRLGPTEYQWGDMPEPPVAIPGITKFV